MVRCTRHPRRGPRTNPTDSPSFHCTAPQNSPSRGDNHQALEPRHHPGSRRRSPLRRGARSLPRHRPKHPAVARTQLHRAQSPGGAVTSSPPPRTSPWSASHPSSPPLRTAQHATALRIPEKPRMLTPCATTVPMEPARSEGKSPPIPHLEPLKAPNKTTRQPIRIIRLLKKTAPVHLRNPVI
jgi:hypothetical protein